MTWQDVWDFLTSSITFYIAILHWLIVNKGASISIIQKKAPNTKSDRTKMLGPTKSLGILKDIYKVSLGLIIENFVVMIS